MGIVYLARERRTGLAVAVKLLDATLAENPEARRRFTREARTVAGLDHPHIVRTLAIEELAGSAIAIVSEFVPGSTLRAHLRANAPLTFDRATSILRDVSSALAHAHRVRLVHGDVKPENIYISEASGHALLADFGISRTIGATAGENLTTREIAFGTPAYMSPEQVAGEAIDERADVYSLGLVGWEMLTGVRPWEGEPPHLVLHKQQFESLPGLATLLPTIPAFLLSAIEGALTKDAAKRWRDGGELLARLSPTPVPLRGRRGTEDQPTEALTLPVTLLFHAHAPDGDQLTERIDSIRDARSSAEKVHDEPLHEREEPEAARADVSAGFPVTDAATPASMAFAAEPIVPTESASANSFTEFPEDAKNDEAEVPAERRRRTLWPIAAGVIAVAGALASLVTPAFRAAPGIVMASAPVSRFDAGEVAIGNSVSSVRPDSAVPRASAATSPDTSVHARRAVPNVTATPKKELTEARAARPTPPAPSRRSEVRRNVRPTKSESKSREGARRAARSRRDSRKESKVDKSATTATVATPLRDERCRSPRAADQEACLRGHAARGDVSLNATLRSLESALARTTPQSVRALRAEQLAWSRERVTKCERLVSAKSRVLWGLERAPCYASLARQRDSALRSRLQERTTVR